MVLGLGLIFISPVFGDEAEAWKCVKHPEKEDCEGTTTTTGPEEEPRCPCEETSTTVSDRAYIEETTSSTASSTSTTTTTHAVVLIPPTVIHSDPHPPPVQDPPLGTTIDREPQRLENLPVTGGSIATIWAGLLLVAGGGLVALGRPRSIWTGTAGSPGRFG